MQLLPTFEWNPYLKVEEEPEVEQACSRRGVFRSALSLPLKVAAIPVKITWKVVDTGVKVTGKVVDTGVKVVAVPAKITVKVVETGIKMVDGKALLCAAGGAAVAVAAMEYIKRRKEAAEEEPAKGAIVTVSTTSTGSSGAKGGGTAVYETPKAVDEYLMFHYAEDKELMPYKGGPTNALQFPARCAALCALHCKTKQGNRRALDVGCAVGRSAFELTRKFEGVVGVDFSEAFIRAASTMRDQGQMEYVATEESEITKRRVATLPKGVAGDRARFEVGDACKLGPHLGQFDAVLAANLLCRLPDPMSFLARLPGLVKPGGVVVLVSPYSWLEAWTPKQKWLGGYTKDEMGVRTAPVVKAVMDYAFELVEESDMPFIIREHARKYQWGCSHATVWRRREQGAERAKSVASPGGRPRFQASYKY